MMLQVKLKNIATSSTQWGWSNGEAVLLTLRRSSQTRCCLFFLFFLSFIPLLVLACLPYRPN